eukprot:jgi/Chrzof1/8355/Cz03g07110.t1
MSAAPHLQHHALTAVLQRPLELREQVVVLAKRRLKMDGLVKTEVDLQPGGKFDGRPADYAIANFLFYECSKCNQPYFGGAKDCMAAAERSGAGAFDASQLMCGSCSALACAEKCKKHGSQYVEWKCRYCCNIASWFCFGTTHMCTKCHEKANLWQPQQNGHRGGSSSNSHPKCDSRTCQLKVPHPSAGTEFCLGCGICRHAEDK